MVGLHWAAAGESNENSFRLAHNHPKYAPSAQFDGHWIGVKYQVLGSLNQRLWCTLVRERERVGFLVKLALHFSSIIKYTIIASSSFSLRVCVIRLASWANI